MGAGGILLGGSLALFWVVVEGEVCGVVLACGKSLGEGVLLAFGCFCDGSGVLRALVGWGLRCCGRFWALGSVVFDVFAFGLVFR